MTRTAECFVRYFNRRRRQGACQLQALSEAAGYHMMPAVGAPGTSSHPTTSSQRNQKPQWSFARASGKGDSGSGKPATVVKKGSFSATDPFFLSARQRVLQVVDHRRALEVDLKKRQEPSGPAPKKRGDDGIRCSRGQEQSPNRAIEWIK